MSVFTGGIPSPTGGWVSNKPIDSMAPNEALVLDNYIPNSLNVNVRKGYEAHATGIGGEVKTIIDFNNGATAKLLVCGNASIFDGTDEGAVGTALATSFLEDAWQWVNFKGRVFAVNGADEAIDFDGTTISTTSWTGVDTENLINVSVFKNRLFFTEKDTAKFWYAAGDAISGALTAFDLSMVSPNGGYLVATASFTRDGGEGSDDLFMCIMQSGDVLVYQGDDPSDPTAWEIVGRYIIAPPIGRRCVSQVGGDLAVVTEDGYISIGTVFGYARSRSDTTLSNNIANYVRDLASRGRTLAGWQALLYYRGGYLLFNAPLIGGKFEQHIVNMTTGAWSKLRDIPARCWGLFQNDLYFGSADGTVYKADTGYTDNGANIKTEFQSSFNYLESRGMIKLFKMIRPLFRIKGDVPISIGMNTDFRQKGITYTASLVDSESTMWGSPWGSPWSPLLVNKHDWRSVSPPQGYCCSVILKTDCKAQFLELNAIDVLYEGGAAI